MKPKTTLLGTNPGRELEDYLDETMSYKFSKGRRERKWNMQCCLSLLAYFLCSCLQVTLGGMNQKGGRVMNVTKAEFSSLIKTFEGFDEGIQLRIFNNWPTFKMLFLIMKLNPFAWHILKSAIKEIYQKSVAESN